MPKAGAATLAFHPLQTFSDPVDRRVPLRGRGGRPHPRAPSARTPRARASSWRDLLGTRPFLLPDDKRTLYHAAASVACNYLVTLEHEAEAPLRRAGLPEDQALELFLPLVRATLDNVARQGTVNALTGPLSRGDLDTIDGHL